MNFYKILLTSYKNGNAKDCKFFKQFWKISKFAKKRKWYVIDNESKGSYSHASPIKFLTASLESSLCDYSDACILVTGNTAVAGADNNTKVAFKNCAPFRKCRAEINIFIDEAE